MHNFPISLLFLAFIVLLSHFYQRKLHVACRILHGKKYINEIKF